MQNVSLLVIGKVFLLVIIDLHQIVGRLLHKINVHNTLRIRCDLIDELRINSISE